MKHWYKWLLIVLGVLLIINLGGSKWVVEKWFLKLAGGNEEYLACGCGCCGGAMPSESKCVFTRKNFEEIKMADETVARQEMCKLAGCSAGIRYKYCGWF